MNRRGFIAFVASAPAAAVAALKEPRFNFGRVWRAIDKYQHRPTATGTYAALDAELARQIGMSHGYMKAQAATRVFHDAFFKR